MKPYTLAVIFLIPLLIFSSCKKEKQGEVNIPGIDEVIDDTIVARITPPQRYTLLHESYYLSCNTLNDYLSTGYRIIYSMNINNDNINVHFLGIKNPVGAVGHAFSPAVCEIPLKDIKNGIYNLTLLLNGQASNYTLTKTDTSYHVTQVSQQKNVYFMEGTLFEVPEDLIWGDISHNKGASVIKNYEWLDSSLQENGAIPTTLPQGNYWYFNTDSNGTITHNYGKSYMYKYSGDIEDLKFIYKQLPDSVKAILNDAKGKTIYSYL